MQNLPNILPMEVAVVVAAALLLCGGPAVLAWSDERRRRRRERERLAEERRAAMPAAEVAIASMPAGSGEPVVALPEVPPQAAPEMMPMVEAAVEPSAAPFDIPNDVAEAAALPVPDSMPPALEAMAPPPVEQPQGDSAAFDATVPSARYELHLDELRRVRLPDWPPEAVRHDSQRLAVWREAEQLAEAHHAAIGATPLHSPYRAQSSCLGGAESEGTRLRLRFLLFPMLWPVSDTQAVAEAVFEMDRDGGNLRSWVGARSHGG